MCALKTKTTAQLELAVGPLLDGWDIEDGEEDDDGHLYRRFYAFNAQHPERLATREGTTSFARVSGGEPEMERTPECPARFQPLVGAEVPITLQVGDERIGIARRGIARFQNSDDLSAVQMGR